MKSIHMRHTFLTAILTTLLLSILFFSCKREFENPRWNTQVLAPLVKTSLTIKDLIKDTSLVKVDTNNSIALVNRQQIFDYSLDSLVSLTAPPYHNNVKLSSLQLADQVITRSISLGQIALQLQAQGNPLGAEILLFSQINFPVPFPGATGIHAGPINIDISKFFQSAVLTGGTMNVQLTNGLPVTINTIQFSLSNENPASVITTQTFNNITPLTSQSQSTDLTGQSIGSTIGVSIDNMDLGSGSFVVDTSVAITVQISISNIQVSSATAIFPAQDVINQTTNVTLLNMQDKLLTKAIIDSGSVQALVYSTADDTIYFSYTIPSATKNGQVFHFDAKVPPNKPGGSVYTSSFAGYTLDLTAQQHLLDTFNTFYNVLVGRINYTGKLVSLSLDDSLDITLTLIGAKPSYVKGYLGQDTLSVGPGNVGIDIFNNISANVLNFKSTQMNVVFENSLGIHADATLQQLTAYNTPKGTNASLNGASINTPYTIAPAIDGSPLPTVVATTIDLSTGTNAVSLLNILPDKISYAGSFKTNPLGNTQTYSDFASSGVDLKAYLDLKIPLSLIASSLVLSDTVSFAGSTLNTAGFQNGIFNLLVYNGFPLDASINMYFLNQYGTKLDSITTTNPVAPAPIDPSTGMVTSTKYSAIPFTFTSARLNNILQNTSKIVFTAKFNTDPANTHVTIYSNYSVEFKLVGDMNVQVNSGQ